MFIQATAGCFSDPGVDDSGTAGSATAATTTTTSTTQATDPGDPVCGDGVAEPPEQCDDGDQDNNDECTALCLPPACGDGFQQPGEACDEGPANGNTGACKLDCTPVTCGDGFVGPGEACDDGNLVDGDGCSSNCQSPAGATCGDLIVDPPEECDDGNLVDTDACLSTCKQAACGDGFLWTGQEACDDGNLADLDGCSALCELEGRLVFVTSTTYQGNLGGVTGADQKCQDAATSAGLPGTYRAWISTQASSPATSFTKSTFPYIRLDKVVVAANWEDLVDGTLLNPINVTEINTPAPSTTHASCTKGTGPIAWTGTDPPGTQANTYDCFDWASSGANATSLLGDPSAVGSEWTSWCGPTSCALQASLYCFQQ